MTTFATAALLAAAAPAASERTPTLELTLDQALEAFERNNPTVWQARARVRAAAAAARQARGSFLPKLSASGSYVANNEEVRVPLGQILPGQAGDLLIQPRSVGQAELGVEVPLFAGGAYWEWLAAGHQAEASDADAEATIGALRAGLVEACWLAHAAAEAIDVRETALASARENLSSTRRAVKAGTETPLAETRARAEVLRQQTDLVRARADLERLRWAIGTLLGADAPAVVTMPEPVEPDTLDEKTAIERALANRGEIGAAESRERAARASSTASWMRYLPTVAATASGFAATEPFAFGDKTGWQAGVHLTWQLYDGGVREASVDRTAAERDASAHAKDAITLRVHQEVRDALREVTIARERLQLATQQHRVASEAAETAERSYAAGLVGALENLDAMTRRDEAALDVETARVQWLIGLVRLQRAQGDL